MTYLSHTAVSGGVDSQKSPALFSPIIAASSFPGGTCVGYMVSLARDPT